MNTWNIDSAHSEIGFKIKHLMISTVKGKFTSFKGSIEAPEEDLTKAKISFTAQVTSINTGNETRDKDLRSARFFDVATYPNITFKSSAVTEVAKGQYNVTGTLTMHGVSNTIVIPITQKGPGPGQQPGTLVAGFKGAVKLKRSDYGIKTMIGPIGDETTIALTVEADAPETK